MPQYPAAIPTMSTVSTSSTDPLLKSPHARHINAINREIEGITTTLGTNPKIIDDTVSPNPNPDNVAEYLDMLANIFKNLVGVTNWYSAAVPLRQLVGGHGAGTQVSSGSTSYLVPCASGLNSQETQIQLPVPFPVTVWNMRLTPLTNQSTTGALTVTLRKNSANTAMTFTIPAGSGSIGGSTGSIHFVAGDLMSVSLANAATTSSCQIGGWTMEMDQAG